MAHQSKSRPLVLLVEDDDLIAAATEHVLRRDWVVTRASDGLVATQYLELDDGYDVILSDVVMPRIGGLGFLRWIREKKPLLLPKMLFVTSDLDTEDAEEIALSHRVLKKPCPPAALRLAMIAVLNNTKATEPND